MYCLPTKTAAAVIVLLATTALVACSDSSSTSETGASFGSNAEAANSANETTEETTSQAPDSVPDMGIETVAYDDFETESFTLEETTVVYISVENPGEELFDVWLMDDLDLVNYQAAIDNLPASASSDNQFYLEDYGLDLSGTIFEGTYLNYDLAAGDYTILIDNTELGDNQPATDTEVEYQFVVYADDEQILISEDEE